MPNIIFYISDTHIICKAKAGNPGTSIPIVSALSTDKVNMTFNYTYEDNPTILDIKPSKAFIRGGNNVTIIGKNLNIAIKISLRYRVACLYSDGSAEIEQPCASINETIAVCKAIDFCEHKSPCRNQLPENRGECNSSTVLGADNTTITIQYEVSIDDELHAFRPNKSELSLFSSPKIFAWENQLKTITDMNTNFSVPGERLDEGASLEDYTVTINGVKATPIALGRTRLFVKIPGARPTGPTLVSVGNLHKDVGNLTIQSAKSGVQPEVIYIPIVVAMLIIVSIIVLVVVLRRKKISSKLKNPPKRSGMEIGYLNRNGEAAFINFAFLASERTLIETIKPWVIDRSRLNISNLIGSGQFGKVFKGTIQYNDGHYGTVAIKTVKVNSGEDAQAQIDFLKEATIMKNFDHPNVLSLVGIVFDNENIPMVILPYMEHGDLKRFISKENQDFTIGDLTHYSMQISNGMAYLSSLKFIHRDLAARNCVVNSEYIIKIADFGLAHDIYKNDYYRISEGGNKLLPVRWMALESLVAGIYTTQSDVWSFGVVMWELFTRGGMPYSSVDAVAISALIRRGERLDKPMYCPDIIYDIMRSCWESEPKYRPTFALLSSQLQDILNRSEPDYTRIQTKNIQHDYYMFNKDEGIYKELYLNLV